MRVLVAGGSGFLGRNFIIGAPREWEIHATYMRSENFIPFLEEHRLGNVKALRVDMSDRAAVEHAFAAVPDEFDVCLYAMGNSDIGLARREPLRDLQANVHSLLNLIPQLRVGRFIFISSGAVYEGHEGLVSPSLPLAPTIPYSVNKLSSEFYIRYYQKNSDRIARYVNIRFFGAYGPMEPARKIYTRMIRAFALGGRSSFRITGNGRNFIDAIYSDDAVRALLKVATSDKGNLTVDLCRGTPLTINELVAEVGRIFGKKVALEHEGDAPEYTTFYASPRAMEALFDFRPTTTLEEGMTGFAEFLRGRRGG